MPEFSEHVCSGVSSMFPLFCFCRRMDDFLVMGEGFQELATEHDLGFGLAVLLICSVALGILFIPSGSVSSSVKASVCLENSLSALLSSVWTDCFISQNFTDFHINPNTV